MVETSRKSRKPIRTIALVAAVLGVTAVGVFYCGDKNPSRNDGVVYFVPNTNNPTILDVSRDEAHLLRRSLEATYRDAYDKKTLTSSLSSSGEYTLHRSDSCNVEASNLEVLGDLIEGSGLDYKVVTIESGMF